MKCPDCNGEMNTARPFYLFVSCRFREIAYACKVCGRFFWDTGKPVFSRNLEKVFLKNGDIVHRDDYGKETIMKYDLRGG